MSEKSRFSTCSVVSLSGPGVLSGDRPAHAARTTRKRIREQRMNDRIRVVTYREKLRPAFEQLNREWIETYFVLEDADREIFEDPTETVLASGGQIFFVIEGDTVLGTCAVLRHSDAEV